MSKKEKKQLALLHILPIALLAIVLFAPKARQNVKEPWAMITALCIIEAVFLISFFKKVKIECPTQGICDIMFFIWLLFIVWELYTSVSALGHLVLIPAPENVFYTFKEQWKNMLLNIAYSMELLLSGFVCGMALALILGLVAGWIPRLRNFAYPIANVLAPIPPVVFSPYLVSLMPTFRSASVLVIFLGVFWPNFLSIINRVQSIEPRILDSARMLNLNNRKMIFNVLLPYVLPGVVGGLKVSMTTSLLMLNFAELMGAIHGLGYFIQNSITYTNYTHAVAGIIVIGLVVTVLNKIMGFIQTHLISWR